MPGHMKNSISCLFVLGALACSGENEMNGWQSGIDGTGGVKGEDVRRTVVLIQAPTEPGQTLFVRGGLDHALAKKLLGRDCTEDNGGCVIPIAHRNLHNPGTQPWKQNDTALDWYGRQEEQDGEVGGEQAEGTPLDWTTNDWPAFWGPAAAVETQGYGLTPLNRFGPHYWMLDVDMDCARALPAEGGAWFELKTLLDGDWEGDIYQPGVPFPSVNHLARCGMLNVFARDRDEAHILPLEIGASVSVAGAGDIGYENDGKDRTARLLERLYPSVEVIFTAGDNIQGNAYEEDEARREYREWFAPSWGRFGDKLRPAPGNHDFMASYGRAYFEHFGAIAGDPEQGWYSYDIGPRWHAIVLNSNNAYIPGRWPAELDWLRADLEKNRDRHVLAYWHHPRFSSGWHVDDRLMKAYWDLLYEYGAELVLNGHDHHFERFAPQTPDGELDEEFGVRQFIVGTGGVEMRSIPFERPNSALRHTDTWGVLKLTLHESWYEWAFVPVDGGRFTDSGSTFCHDAP